MDQPLKWHGGKHYLAEWIRTHSPKRKGRSYTHRVHVFGGGLGEFWDWSSTGVSEVVNDLDYRLTNLWHFWQNEMLFKEFVRRVEATPFSEIEFNNAQEELKDEKGTPLDRSVAFFVLCRQSRQGMLRSFATLSKNRTRRGMNEQASSWLTAIEGLEAVHDRLKKVVITNKDFEKVIEAEDSANTFFYCDPPYLHSTRTAKSAYGVFEMSTQDHQRLLRALLGLKGMFLLSGYHSELYDNTAKIGGWSVSEKEIDNKASSQKVKPKKVECLWSNYA